MFGVGVNVWEAISRLFGPKNMGGQFFFNGLLAGLTNHPYMAFPNLEPPLSLGS